MQWTIINVGNLNDAKAAPLILAVQTTCLASGQGDPTVGLISTTVEQVRGAVGFSGKYLISQTAGSLPPNLVDMAVQKIVRICKRRLEQPLTQDERDEENQFQKVLEALRAGRYPVDNPDDPVAVNPSNPAGRVSPFGNTCRPFSTYQIRYL